MMNGLLRHNQPGKLDAIRFWFQVLNNLEARAMRLAELLFTPLMPILVVCGRAGLVGGEVQFRLPLGWGFGCGQIVGLPGDMRSRHRDQSPERCGAMRA